MRGAREVFGRRGAAGRGTVIVAIMFAVAGPLFAQATPPLTGVVVDGATGSPLEGVLVTGPSAEFRATTDAQGRFEIELPAGPQPVTFTAYGYLQTEFSFDPVTAPSPVRVELQPRPIEIEGIDAVARTFRARLDSVATYLDRSARGPRWTGKGVPRIADRADLARYDDENDAEIALAALGLFPAFDFECGWRHNGRNMRPAGIFIDGEKEPLNGCLRFQNMDVSTVCRVELIPTGGITNPQEGLAAPHNLFVWTCGFMARLANGEESIPKLFEVLIPDWWDVQR